jgi:hypothetical protein
VIKIWNETEPDTLTGRFRFYVSSNIEVPSSSCWRWIIQQALYPSVCSYIIALPAQVYFGTSQITDSAHAGRYTTPLSLFCGGMPARSMYAEIELSTAVNNHQCPQFMRTISIVYNIPKLINRVWSWPTTSVYPEVMAGTRRGRRALHVQWTMRHQITWSNDKRAPACSQANTLKENKRADLDIIIRNQDMVQSTESDGGRTEYGDCTHSVLLCIVDCRGHSATVHQLTKVCWENISWK